MNLIGKSVEYGKLGTGIVQRQQDNRIWVEFPNQANQTAFIIPTSFLIGAIRFTNPADKAQFDADIAAEHHAARAANEAAITQTQQRIEERAKASTRVVRTPRQTNRQRATTASRTDNNLAFNCNFCDGGATPDCIGFKDICSEEQIKNNVYVNPDDMANSPKKQIWCAKPACPCRKKEDGEITRGDIVAMNANQFVCYESGMLINWMAAAGEDCLDENGEMKSRRIVSAAVDTLAVLTTLLQGAQEKDRIVFALFIVGEAFVGDEARSGYVKATNDFKLELLPNEAKAINFWDCYSNKDESKSWRTGLFRYLKNDTCVNILLNIINLNGVSAATKAKAKEILEYFCNAKNIPNPLNP